MESKSKNPYKWLIYLGLLMVVAAIVLHRCGDQLNTPNINDIVITGPR